MKVAKTPSEPLNLAHGDALPFAALRHVWRLESGALRINRVLPDGEMELMSIALPGDLLGVDRLTGAEDASHTYAITPAQLSQVRIPSAETVRVLQTAYRTARQRCVDMVALRSGSVPDRVRRLLLLLAESNNPSQDAASSALPSLREMADIVGSAHETVSRVIGSLKHLELLSERRAQSGTFRVQSLRDCRFTAGMTSSSLPLRLRAVAA
jgi:CRP-like cAMP-binding protein